MKKIIYLLFTFSCAGAFCATADTMCKDRYPQLCQGSMTYQCFGSLVSGTIQIKPLDKVTVKAGGSGVAYYVVSSLRVGPRTYKMQGSYEVQYKRRYLDRFGTWVPNYDFWLYNLLAANQKFNPSHIPLFLEVSYGKRIHGYMAYREDTSPRDPRFNFTCTRRR